MKDQKNTKPEKSHAHSSISHRFEDQMLQSLLILVQDGICFLSENLDVLYANPAMRFWYEIKENSVGKKCFETYHGRTEPCPDCPALKALLTGEPEFAERKYETQNVSKGWQRVFCMPVQDKEQGTFMIIEYVRDITNERKSESSIELMKNQIESLTEIISQKEKERQEKTQQLLGNMNRSIDVVLRYLNKILDDDSYNLIKNQLSMTNNGIEMRDAVQHKLSGQELVIARMIAEGYMSKEIADKIKVSKKTIDYHRTNIRKKLGLKSEDNLKMAIIQHFEESGVSQM